MSHKHLLGLLGCVCATIGQANAQSAALAWGGNPKILSGPSSIHMDSEKVRLKIGATWTSVTCAYVLRNDGPACKVRLGFPDQTFGPSSDSDDGGTSDDAEAHLSSFQAFVDGQKTTTTLASGKEGEGSAAWHERTIPFTRRQKRIVVDEYKVHTGTAMASGKVPIHEVAFLMRTGASFKGAIKKVEVVAEISDDLMPNSIMATPARKLHVKWATEYEDWDEVSRNTVYYHAFAAPSTDDTKLTFHATNLNPSKTSDVYLYFRASGKAHHKESTIAVRKRRRKPVTRHKFTPEATEQ